MIKTTIVSNWLKNWDWIVRRPMKRVHNWNTFDYNVISSRMFSQFGFDASDTAFDSSILKLNGVHWFKCTEIVRIVNSHVQSALSELVLFRNFSLSSRASRTAVVYENTSSYFSKVNTKNNYFISDPFEVVKLTDSFLTAFPVSRLNRCGFETVSRNVYIS